MLDGLTPSHTVTIGKEEKKMSPKQRRLKRTTMANGIHETGQKVTFMLEKQRERNRLG